MLNYNSAFFVPSGVFCITAGGHLSYNFQFSSVAHTEQVLTWVPASITLNCERLENVCIKAAYLQSIIIIHNLHFH